MTMRIDILTLFPEMCERVLDESIIGAARKNGLVELRCHNIRDYSDDKHRRVDDYPYGGGQGMLMKPEPIAACFEAVCKQVGKKPLFVYMSPCGRVFRQDIAVELSRMDNICILCGHYEGVDQRLLDEYVDMELSIGDYVLTGGELAALVISDAVVRLLPGVLAEEQSFTDESHYNGLLEYPQYTRPPIWNGRRVPEVLSSGNRRLIDEWKKERSMEVTKEKRPDMYSKIWDAKN